jgi:hypothetical protein
MKDFADWFIEISYEVLGVIIPGVVASVFFLLILFCAEPILVRHHLIGASTLSLKNMGWMGNEGLNWQTWLLLTLQWFFLGQMVLQFARDKKSRSKGQKFIELAFMIRPCEPHYFRPSMEEVFVGCLRKLGLPVSDQQAKVADSEPTPGVLKPVDDKKSGPSSQFKVNPDDQPVDDSGWRPFQRIARAKIAQAKFKSLLTMFQNKYTLHRSIATIAGLSFWASVVLIVLGAMTHYTVVDPLGAEPRWGLLIPFCALFIIVKHLFMRSFREHWKHYGDTLIAEIHSILLVDDVTHGDTVRAGRS